MTPPLESRDELPLETRDELLVEAVNTLMAEVRKLNEQVSQFPKREEVRSESRTRAWRFLGFAVAIIMASQLLTMSLVSYCFLDANSTHKMACNAMPGYAEAMQQNNIRLGRFELLLTNIESNQQNLIDTQRDIIILQEQVNKLKEQG
jgi:hypothetical protein